MFSRRPGRCCKRDCPKCSEVQDTLVISATRYYDAEIRGARRGKTILVVDDDPGIQELLRLALEGEGISRSAGARRL